MKDWKQPQRACMFEEKNLNGDGKEHFQKRFERFPIQTQANMTVPHTVYDVPSSNKALCLDFSCIDTAEKWLCTSPGTSDGDMVAVTLKGNDYGSSPEKWQNLSSICDRESDHEFQKRRAITNFQNMDRWSFSDHEVVTTGACGSVDEAVISALHDFDCCELLDHNFSGLIGEFESESKGSGPEIITRAMHHHLLQDVSPSFSTQVSKEAVISSPVSEIFSDHCTFSFKAVMSPDNVCVSREELKSPCLWSKIPPSLCEQAKKPKDLEYAAKDAIPKCDWLLDDSGFMMLDSPQHEHAKGSSLGYSQETSFFVDGKQKQAASCSSLDTLFAIGEVQCLSPTSPLVNQDNHLKRMSHLKHKKSQYETTDLQDLFHCSQRSKEVLGKISLESSTVCVDQMRWIGEHSPAKYDVKEGKVPTNLTAKFVHVLDCEAKVFLIDSESQLRPSPEQFFGTRCGDGASSLPTDCNADKFKEPSHNSFVSAHSRNSSRLLELEPQNRRRKSLKLLQNIQKPKNSDDNNAYPCGFAVQEADDCTSATCKEPNLEISDTITSILDKLRRPMHTQ